MKFIKKVAALCFCAALALSVMAISAMADGRVTFEVSLEKTAGDLHQDRNANTILDYAVSETATYDIKLKVPTGTVYQTYTVNALDFKVNAQNATIQSVIVGDLTANPPAALTATARGTSEGGNYAYYAYTEQYGRTTWTLNQNGEATIGRITIQTTTQDTYAKVWLTDVTVHDVHNTGSATEYSGAAVNLTAATNALSTDSSKTDVEVDTKYTITIQKRHFDNGVQNVNQFDTSSVTYYLMSGATKDADDRTYTTDYPLIAAIEPKTAYTIANNNSYVVTSSEANNWIMGWSEENSDAYYTVRSVTNVGATDYKYGNITLTATYTPIDYTATYDFNGGTVGTGTSATSVTYNADNFSNNTLYGTPKRAGYTFTGWEVTDDNLTLPDTRYWSKGEYYTLSVTDQATQNIVAPADSDKTITPIEGLVYGDVSLKATWAANQYTVTYALNGGKVDKYLNDTTAIDPDVTTGTSVTYTTGTLTNLYGTPKKAGYTFAGWKASSISVLDGGIDAANEYSGFWQNEGLYGTGTGFIAIADASPAAHNGAVYGDVTLTAQWTPNEYTITYALDGGAVSTALDGSTSLTGANGEVTYTPANYNTVLYGKPTKVGYTFRGWKVTSDSVEVADIDSTNGYNGYWTVNSRYRGTTEVIAEPAPTQDAPNATIAVTQVSGNTAANDGAVYGSVTLTAIWTANQYTVNYDFNLGETSDTVSVPRNVAGNNFGTAKGKDDATATYTIANFGENLYGTPERAGYTFTGWEVTTGPSAGAAESTDDDDNNATEFWTANGIYGASDVKQADGSAVTAISGSVWGNVTLTARWQAGFFKQVGYQYAPTGMKLTLFAVKTNDIGSNQYAYKVNDDTYNDMYKVDGKYAPLFGTQINGTTALVDSETYTIFATLAETGTISQVKVSPEGQTLSNSKLEYNYNIVGEDTAINSGDYGTVDALFKNGDTYTITVVGIEARLKANTAHADDAIKNGQGYEAFDPTASDYTGTIGNILDIKAIMNQVGKTNN